MGGGRGGAGRYARVQVYERRSVHMCKYANVQFCERAGVKVCDPCC